MPGTIQVSVLELLDLPPSGQASSAASSGECPSGLVSLKIAMGKTEFQTRDKGDFLFPVMSLRENLKLTLLDADGNEISRTDVKTIIVVEKRYWDALFPLDGGGCVHMKLQFILNTEEHKRICEMREAVLKRKHGKLPRSDSKDSVAALNVTENVIGASANIITEEGHMADQLPVKSQDAREKGLFASLEQDLPQQPKNHCEEGAISQPKANEEASVYQANQNSIRETNVSSEAMDPQLRCTGSLVSREIEGTSSSPSAMPQEEIKVSTTKESAHEKFSVTDTKKLISALGNISLQQEQRIHVGSTAESWMRSVKTGGSSRELWPEEKNTEKVTIHKMMPKSFSTGALPQMKSAPFGLSHVEVQKEEKHTDFGVRKKKLGNNMQSIDVQNYEKLDPGNKQTSSKFLCAAESPSGGRTSETSEVIETKKVIKFFSSADIIKNVNKHSLHKEKEGPPFTPQFRHREHEEPGKKIGLYSFSKGVSFRDSETSHQNSNVTTSSSFEEERNMCGYKDDQLHKINKGSHGEQPGVIAFFDGREWVDASEIREDKQASAKDCMVSGKVVDDSAITRQLTSSSMHQRQPKLTIVKAESGTSSTEFSTCGSLDVEIDITYFDAEQCLLGSHGNSIPRHLCITSGSKQLKDIIGGFISF